MSAAWASADFGAAGSTFLPLFDGSKQIVANPSLKSLAQMEIDSFDECSSSGIIKYWRHQSSHFYDQVFMFADSE